jgi:hypothetical protein
VDLFSLDSSSVFDAPPADTWRERSGALDYSAVRIAIN